RFPAGSLDRIVPCADADADAERLTARVGEGAAEIDMVAIVASDRTAEVFERVGSRGRIGNQRLLDCLAGVEGFQSGQFVVAGAQYVGGAPQDAAALDGLQARPGGLRFTGCLD